MGYKKQATKQMNVGHPLVTAHFAGQVVFDGRWLPVATDIAQALPGHWPSEKAG